jgi:pimeloyl-ACP methyl ester carboxylesterase
VLAKAQSQWAIPVSGIWGQEDALYQGALDKVAQQLPNMSTLSIVPDAGHWVMFERPDAFHALVDAWL